jgi:glycine/D-amino acid oxidase-like deaminating enzyme
VDRHADCVVIGAGAFGASVAFHLCQRRRTVVLVDKAEPVTQTSPRAAGLSMNVLGDQGLSRIGMRSIEMLLSFEDITGVPLRVHRNGSIKVARTERDVAQLDDEVERGRQLGADIAPISAGDAQELVPWFNPATALTMWYSPGDTYLTPGDLPRAYIKAARRSGLELLGNTSVRTIETASGRVTAVTTSAGRIHTSTVVVTAGAWSRLVSEMAGIRIPLWPVRHQLCITGPVPGVEPHHPTVRITDARTYCRPEGSGLLFGGYEADPLDIDVRERPSSFEISEMELDFEVLRNKMVDVAVEHPALLSAEVVEVRGGLPTMTPDGRFIVDALPCDGLWVASGCNVGGLSNSPALGDHLAEWITSGAQPDALAPFGIARFGHEFDDEERLRAAGIASYAHKYSNIEVSQT